MSQMLMKGITINRLKRLEESINRCSTRTAFWSKSTILSAERAMTNGELTREEYEDIAKKVENLTNKFNVECLCDHYKR